jgi:hypothetical protein
MTREELAVVFVFALVLLAVAVSVIAGISP